MVRLSVLAGVNPNIRNDSGITPLMEAASYGEVPLANFLLLHGEAVDAADMDGLQAIHWAAREGETSMMSFLLLHGARIDAKDRDDWQPLHYAARNHQDDGSTVRLLLERGANPNAATRAGETPLLIAVDGMSGGTDANALELIAHGADVNVREPGTLETPLMIAMTELSFKSVRVLLCAGADPNVAEKSGRLPIEDALDSEEAAALLA